MSGEAALDRDPAALVAQIESRARRVDTRCGEGTVAWRIWGRDQGAAPLVLGHGAQGAWSHWIRNIDALAQDRLVAAVDLPGQGDSAVPARLDHAGISAAIADGLGVLFGPARPLDFAGFSFSGPAFAWFAHFHPEWVRRLILIGCGGLDTPHGHIDLRRVSGLTGDARQAAIKANLLGLMLHHEASADDLAQHLLIANGRKARWVDTALVLPDRLAHILPRVAAPVDAIWGEFDRPHPQPALQEAVIRRSHPHCDFRVVAGAGHWAMYERADMFNAMLLDMLARAP